MNKSGHRITWEYWIRNLTPMRDAEDADIESMAIALSMAAPKGPDGFPCIDECECDVEVADQIRGAALIIHEELVERGVQPSPELARRLEISLAADLIAHRSDARRPDATLRALGDCRAIVSGRNALIGHARHTFPLTWGTILAVVSADD